jgi:hypothetical protein
MLTSNGGADLFVAKLNAAGGCAWAVSYGDGTNQFGHSVAVDPAKGIVVAGLFDGAIGFGTPQSPHTVVDDGNSSDLYEMFVVKFSADGMPVFSRAFGDAAFDLSTAALAVAVDGAGDILLTGSFEAALTLGGGFYNAGPPDMFVAKLSGASGGDMWVTTSGDDIAAQRGQGIVAGPGNSVVIAGDFTGDLVLKGNSLVTAANEDIFVAALDASGTPLWGKRLGGIGDQRVRTLATNAAGELVLAGAFSGVIGLGPGDPLVGSDAMPGSTKDLFIAKLDPKGAPLWGVRGGDLDEQFAMTAVLSADGVYAAGWFWGDLDLDGPGMSSMGEDDIFVTKIVD